MTFPLFTYINQKKKKFLNCFVDIVLYKLMTLIYDIILRIIVHVMFLIKKIVQNVLGRYAYVCRSINYNRKINSNKNKL